MSMNWHISEGRRLYRGSSTLLKPTVAAVGDMLLEVDTKKTFEWDGVKWDLYDPGDSTIPYLKEIVSQLELLRQEIAEGFLELQSD